MLTLKQQHCHILLILHVMGSKSSTQCQEPHVNPIIRTYTWLLTTMAHHLCSPWPHMYQPSPQSPQWLFAVGGDYLFSTTSYQTNALQCKSQLQKNVLYNNNELIIIASISSTSFFSRNQYNYIILSLPNCKWEILFVSFGVYLIP